MQFWKTLDNFCYEACKLFLILDHRFPGSLSKLHQDAPISNEFLFLGANVHYERVIKNVTINDDKNMDFFQKALKLKSGIVFKNEKHQKEESEL